MNRRSFLSSMLAAPAAAVAASKTPLNVIVILADDLGWGELGCYGNQFNETPNLDRLAHEGVRFTQAYSASPVCSPTRASYMTGQYPARLGINDYLRADDPKYLSPEYESLPKQFARAGYETALIGKWHLMGDYRTRLTPEEFEQLLVRVELKQQRFAELQCPEWCIRCRTPKVHLVDIGLRCVQLNRLRRRRGACV